MVWYILVDSDLHSSSRLCMVNKQQQVFGTHIVAVYTIILKNSPGVQYIYLCNKPFKKKNPKLYKLVVFAAPPLSRQYHGKVGSEYG
jgi:hypothetical protein